MDLTALAAFIGGLILFFALHFFSSFRTREAHGIETRIGKGPYKGLYSVLSIIGFIAMIWGFDTIRWDQPDQSWPQIWSPPAWTRHVNMALMLPALILLVAAYVPTGYIKKAVKHPMLTAVKLWAAGHLLANGDLGGMILFGAFLIYGIVDRIAVKRRGDTGTAKTPHVIGDLLALAVGSAVYALILFDLHGRLFGQQLV
ncbi:MAG: NnrU family protein [Hyphomonadaceae bacterium]|nr:NnrU family protein [Hyphomonadaceae bacterium]